MGTCCSGPRVTIHGWSNHSCVSSPPIRLRDIQRFTRLTTINDHRNCVRLRKKREGEPIPSPPPPIEAPPETHTEKYPGNIRALILEYRA